MPIVFVHGVNNRAGDDYRDNEAGRNGFLREIVAPALGLSADEVSIESPYWGGDGAKFAWDMAVLPDPDESYEAFGAEDDDPRAVAQTVELVAKAPLIVGSVSERARQDFAGTVELIYGAALAGAKTEDEAREVAQSYLLALKYAEETPEPEWVKTSNDANFTDSLEHNIHPNDEESFGGPGFLDKLKEGFSRLANALPAAGTELLGELARKKLNTTITRFAGDAFVYLAKRGQPTQEGPIVQKVLAALDKADQARTDKDAKLIVIAHSFGGEIMYDILTRFRPGLKVDWFVTVGSQVGLFEEMKLYLASDPNIPPHYPDGKVNKPDAAERWLNVFDLNDVLSYRVTPVFSGASDFEYDTGFSTLAAHGGYFLRPSFYVELAKHLKA